MKKSILLITVLFAMAAHSTAQNTAPYWSLVGNSNAAATSKLGTTNGIPLRLFTNNSERMRIDATGKVGIGITTPVAIFTVKSSGGTPVGSWLNVGSTPVFAGFSENKNGELNIGTASVLPDNRAVFQGKRSRGTLAAPTAVLNNDYLLSFVASGYDGGAFQNPATISFYVDGTPSAGNVPGRISFVTGSNTGNRQERLKVGSTGNFDFNNGQMFIQQSLGFVGIGTAFPGAKLDIADPVDNTAISFTKSGLNYGAYFSKTSTSSGVETIFSSNAGSGSGIFATSQNGIGVYGTSATYHGVYGYTGGLQTDGIYAGFFSGAVNATGGYYANSDRNLKRNIQDASNAMDIINKLRPKYYEFKNDGDYKALNLPQGKHYGLIAQDVEEVLPDIVGNTKFETRAGIHNSTEADVQNRKIHNYKSLNYTELIPIVIKGMQEQGSIISKQEKHIQQQQLQIEKQQQQIDELKAILSKVATGQHLTLNENTSGYLEQNTPNPGSAKTSIGYRVPVNTLTAKMIITNPKGQVVKAYTLTNKGTGKVDLNLSPLAAGVYTYALWLDGKQAETKRLVVAK